MNIYTILHYIIILLVILLPFILYNSKHLLIYIMLVILIIMHWKFNNNECILTNLERNKYPEEFKNCEEKDFITKHLHKYGFESIAEFEYLTEVIALSLILLSAVKIFRESPN